MGSPFLFIMTKKEGIVKINYSILVAFLYSSKPGLRDWRLSAIGMLTKRNIKVFTRAPQSKNQLAPETGIEKKQVQAIPHHMRISQA